ncbi:FMN-linked oxidoreductase [Calocera viscosa TUFC12733]|uniref:FMN-linked oxidoreductase n=1 Tax=Calocera viscosa (strain TUFC12733) TaxID=1330018 RepID=A0A167L7E0_CALVF|nr:FMN-linked oxidoreductase [Calocera viscosa TUFC12733]
MVSGEQNGKLSELSNAEVLRQPLTLPCGKIVPTRLVKAAMYEALASLGGGPPNSHHFRLYEVWSDGGWGIILSGNIFVDPRYQGLGQDLIVLPRSKWDAYRRLARCIKGTKPRPSAPLALMQLSHAGRQSSRGNFRPPWSPALAPSPIPMDAGEGWLSTIAYRAVYGVPKEMTQKEIDTVVQQFTEGAVMAHETGWDGIEIHCAHGYLLSSFLSPRTNHRRDAYGCSTRGRAKILLDVIASVRAAVPSSFCVGVKLNCKDFVKGGLSEEEALEQVRMIHQQGGVDYIELSGGTYELAGFMDPSDPTAKPWFERFAASASSILADDPNAPRIVLTGNIRSRVQCADVIRQGTAQLCGMARPAAIDPKFASKLLDTRIPDSEAITPTYDIKGGSLVKALPVRIIGASVRSTYHNFMLARIARGQKIDIRIGFWPLTGYHLLYSRDFWAFLAFIVGLALLCGWTL